MSDFEAWYFGMFPLEKAMIEAGSGVAARNRDLYLRCWQASRADVVVELPPIWEQGSNTALGQACAQIRTADIQAIEAQGLKVAP